MVWFTKLTVLFSLECGWVGGVCWVVVFLEKEKVQEFEKLQLWNASSSH